MPSVASENSAIAHTRHHQPTNRARTDHVDREQASPFAGLLDSGAPANEPPRTPRNARAERSDAARPAEHRRRADDVRKRDDSRPANEARDTKDAGGTDEAKAGDEPTKPAKSGDEAAAASGADDSRAATDADEKTEAALDAEFAAALAGLVGDTAQPAASTEIAVAVTLLPASTEGAVTDLTTAAEAAAASAETPAIDPLAALKAAAPGGTLQAAEDQAAAQGDIKAGTTKTDAKDEAKTPSQARLELSANAPAAAPQKDADEDGDTGNKGNQRPDHDIRHGAEKAEAKPQDNHGAEVSAVARQGAANAQSSIVSTPAGADAGAAATAATQPPGLAVAAAHAQPTSLTSPQLQAHIQAQLQTGANASPAIPLSGVAVEIASQALTGKNRFEIRLDPPELGRIDVKLDIDSDGNATTRLLVERSDTLDLLKRDSSQLERALQQAGLKTSDNALEFALRQEAFQQNDQDASNGAQIVLPDEDTPLHAQRQNYGRLLGMGGGLDIRV